MSKLVAAGPDRFDPAAMPVMALVHNEANIAADFLAHYRRICRPSFLIVDDHSDDGTREFLASQPDVSLFSPVDGSTYAADKSVWRSELLDRHCDGHWVIVPDIDEHFVFPSMETRPLDAYIAALEAEGAEAVVTLMIDMYADRPLEDHVYDTSQGTGLAGAFPFFDGPAPAPDGYFMRRARGRYPTPPVVLSGGMRDRIFTEALKDLPADRLAKLERTSRLDQPINPGLAGRLRRRFADPALRCCSNRTKLGLLKWRAGMAFNGGAHKVDTRLQVSESIAAFLHYIFTRGRAGLEYIAARGQHAGGARGYRETLERGDLLSRSPMAPLSRRYEDSTSLAGLIRDIPGRR